jgi:hypothetical protein
LVEIRGMGISRLRICEHEGKHLSVYTLGPVNDTREVIGKS